MQCQHCGRQTHDPFKFCPECGLPAAQQARAEQGSIAAIGDGNLSVTGSAGGDLTSAQVHDGAVAADGSTALGREATQMQVGDVGDEATVIFAERGATVVIGEAPVPMPAVDGESALGRYLRHVIGRNRYLQLQGLRSGGRLVHIELDRIYITLRATRRRLIEAEDAWLAQEVALAPGEERRLHAGRPSTETVTVSVNEALAAHSRLVILGDPGSGKTTLLRYLALLYARDLAEGAALVGDKLGLPESGRLPLLLPLRQIGAYLHAHRPVEDGAEGHALLLDFVRESLANERIRELAINPLMLTVSAMVHRDRVKLPDRRAELYAEAVDVLLGKWAEAKEVRETPILEDQPFDTGDKRLMLQSVALRMHEAAQKEVAAEDLRRWLGEMFHEMVGDWRAAARAVDHFLRVIEERTGLLWPGARGSMPFPT